MALLTALLLTPPAAAQVPGIEDAITDGEPFELDPGQPDALRSFAGRVSGLDIHDCVEEVTTSLEGQYRLMGTPTQDLFLEAYQDVFTDIGLDSALHHFDDAGPGIGVQVPTGGTNILGVLPGNDLTKWIVMGGHYDTREGAGPGALDNASGICTVREIAAAMKEDVDENGPYEASIVFAWYDGEEWGLYGAVAFAEDDSVARDLLGIDEDTEVDVLVSQSYDMPGINFPANNYWPQYDDGGPDQIAVLNLRTAPIHAEEEWRCWSYGCYEELKTRDDFEDILRRNTNYQFLMREVAYDLFGYPPEFVWIYDDNYGRSDHIPLIAKGAAGNRIQGSHDEEYPCYHQPCDRLEWLYQQVGGQENLVAAYDTEAQIGATVARYVADHGDFGRYGDVLWFGEPAVLDVEVDESTPGPALIGIVALVGVAVLLRRPQR